MFRDALFEAAGRPQRLHPATVLAFVLQSIAVAVVVIAPLLRIAPPPQVRSIIESISFAPAPPPSPPTTAAQESHAGFSQVIGPTVLQPREIPPHPAVIDDKVQPPPMLGDTVVAGGTGTITGHNITDVLGGPAVTPVRPPGPARPVLVSTGVMQGLLLTSARPKYPRVAQAARIQGTVVLIATISREGVIENIHVVSGHPMLVGAAIDAVRQWRYRPYLLNGLPIEVETQITVNFVISGG